MAKDTGDREQEILEAAIKVFSDKGFDGSTTSEIAKTAGIAEGTIFRYFKTKKDILRKIIIKLMDTISSLIIVEPVAKIIEANKDKDERELLFLILKDRLKLVDKNLSVIKIVLSELLIRKELREAWGDKVVSKIKDIV
jgi:AcrR family transcriptional regulator